MNVLILRELKYDLTGDLYNFRSVNIRLVTKCQKYYEINSTGIFLQQKMPKPMSEPSIQNFTVNSFRDRPCKQTNDR